MGRFILETTPPKGHFVSKYEHFEELPVWQESSRLYNRVLDLLEQRDLPLTGGFRNRLERAALSISHNIAEGFERVTTAQLVSFLSIARGSGGEVRSMIAVIVNRPRLKPFRGHLNEIRSLAESCARQLTAWVGSIESSSVAGNRHLSPRQREQRRVTEAARDFRLRFLRNLKPEHPLYGSSEARQARGATE
jgi:four helix bundle protein